ncbi:MAG: hypothetical protein U9Q99_01385 [Nanoarchaeota archaeon]|nr:hypothetical protein [Nanoarchaeota archaeon]
MSSNRFKRNYDFSLKEKKDFLITTSVLTLVFFFLFSRISWMNQEATIFLVVSKIIILWLITALILFMMIFIAKKTAIKKAYTAKYSAWKNGLFIGFVISFISYGFLPLLFPGLITINRIERLRHGKLFPGENTKHISFILIMVFFYLFITTIISQLLFFIFKVELFYYFATIAALIAAFSALPFNNNIGLHLFRVNKQKYFFVLFFSILLAVFVLLKMILALVFAVLGTMLIYFLTKKLISKFLIPNKK